MPFPVSGAQEEGGTLWCGRQAVLDSMGWSVRRGHPSGEMELTARYTEAVCNGDKSEFIQRS